MPATVVVGAQWGDEGKGKIVDLLAREIIAAEKTSAFQERLVRVGVDPIVATPAEFAEIIAADTARWRDIVRELDLKPH